MAETYSIKECGPLTQATGNDTDSFALLYSTHDLSSSDWSITQPGGEEFERSIEAFSRMDVL